MNWSAFTGLPGSEQKKFELMCRNIIRRTYGQFGSFRALSQQPGVEFHIQLTQSCQLGKQGDWIGWQCKWFNLGGTASLTANQKNQILDSLSKTRNHLPNLNRWILWMPTTLTKSDQDWYYGQNNGLTLDLWTDSEVEEHLAGDAAVFRDIYFGDLTITEETLKRNRDVVLAPIKKRWKSDLHQILEAERETHKYLLRPDAWIELSDNIDFILRMTKELKSVYRTLPSDLSALAEKLLAASKHTIAEFKSILDYLKVGDYDSLQQKIQSSSCAIALDVAVLPSKLRSANHVSTIFATNLIARIRSTARLITDILNHINTRMICISAEAGNGKTQIAAQLASGDDRFSGIVFQGKSLHIGDTIDVLLKPITLNGKAIDRFILFLQTLNSLGQHLGRRIPIIIDGLNESEDPRTWKTELERLEVQVKDLVHILIICTIRPAFLTESIPDKTLVIELDGFGEDIYSAIRKYFDYYKIRSDDATLLNFLKHPLTLFLFCEVTNSNRKVEVGVEAMPTSLTDLFDRFVEQAIERVVELSPPNNRYYSQDVRSALDHIGLSLWNQNSRALSESPLRTQLGDASRPWNYSIVRALEQEGILLRNPIREAHEFELIVVYDLLAGHLVAKAILAEKGRSSFQSWIRESQTIDKLTTRSKLSHPLTEDILRAFVGLIPRNLHREQLWKMLPDPLQQIALEYATRLEPQFLDAETVAKIREAVIFGSSFKSDVMIRLREVRAIPGHLLNAIFFDNCLREMTVADRDLRWTEWVRHESEHIYANIERLEIKWKNDQSLVKERERLRVRWIMWLLSTTDRKLRDLVTRTLVTYGHFDSEGLLNLAIESLSINDPFVVERMMAAIYGLAMGKQIPDREFAAGLARFLDALAEKVLAPNGKTPVNHGLTRLYIKGIFEFGQKFYQIDTYGGSPEQVFSARPTRGVRPANDLYAQRFLSVLSHDFRNYTIGRLCHKRRAYDFQNPEYQSALEAILGIAWDLGWRHEKFEDIEKRISDEYFRFRHPNVTPYAKKYAWIAYFELAGLRRDKLGNVAGEERFSDLGIDPSFPEKPAISDLQIPNWTLGKAKSEANWLRAGLISFPKDLVESKSILGLDGPWVSVEGDLHTRERFNGRDAFGFISALLVSPKDTPKLLSELRKKPYLGNGWLGNDITDHYTFAGEIPWSSQFGSFGENGIEDRDLYRHVIEFSDGAKISVELLSHHFGWERHHSEINDAGHPPVPSKDFSEYFDLRSQPRSFNQCDKMGRIASITVSAPAEYSGNLLYIRKDLLGKYAGSRNIIWVIWGERQHAGEVWNTPEWASKIYTQQEHIWRQIKQISILRKGRSKAKSKPRAKRQAHPRKGRRPRAK